MKYRASKAWPGFIDFDTTVVIAFLSRFLRPPASAAEMGYVTELARGIPKPRRVCVRADGVVNGCGTEVFGGTQAPAMDRGVTDRYGVAATVWRLRSGSPAAGAVTVLCADMFVQKTAPGSLVFTGSKYETAKLPNGE